MIVVTYPSRLLFALSLKVGLKTRVGGTAAALGIPVIILIIAYSVVSNM